MKKNFFLTLLSLLLVLFAYSSSVALNVSGIVWVDANNNNVVDANERATDFGGTMYVNLVNPSGAVINSAQVGANGAYTLTNVADNLTGHKLVLTNTPTNSHGNRVPGLYYVQENVVGTSNTASQTGAALGEINLRTVTGNIGNQNFQMNQQGVFGCLDGIAYQVAVPNGGTVSSLYSYNISSGVRTQIGAALNYNVNSLVYSTASDNMLWATVGGTTNSIVRIGPGAGTVEFVISNLPTGNFNVGVELPNAYMMVYTTNSADYYVIDIDPSRATYLELVDPANGYALKTGPNYGIPVSAPFHSSDCAYLASTGLIYGINTTSNITTLNPATGEVATSATPVAGLPNAAYGGMFSDKLGKLYAFNNATGGFYRIDPATNIATLISTSTPSNGNDAASCPNAIVECDTDISVTPADAAICVGASTTFSVAPEGNGPFTYLWQQSTDGGDTWANMQTTPFTGANGSYSGAGTASLTVTAITAGWNNIRYRCRVTSNLCTTLTSTATLNVYAVPGIPTLIATSDAPACPATTYNLNRLVSSATPAGSTLRFYTSSTPSPETLVADPAAVPSGTYYARYENQGCSGPVSQMITIGSCITPFNCENGVAYQVAASDGETVSSLYAYNVTTGVRTLVAPLSAMVNGLVYNTADNMLWASKNGSNSIVRIGADGTLIEYPIANLPSASYIVASELPSGYMLLYSSGTTYYVVDINPARATYLRLVDPTNGYALQTGPTYGKTASAAMNVRDFVYVPSANLVYSVAAASSELVTFNPFTGAVTTGAVVSGLPTGAQFGAIFADPTGKIYAFANDTGAFYRINTTAASATLLSTSVPSNSNDGASCPNAILENLPFDCADGITYQVAAAAGETVSSLYAFNVNTGARTLIAPLPVLVNSLIYNSVDNMLWATKNATNTIVRIDREGGTLEYPIANLPGAPASYNVGVELPNGYMMVYQTNAANYYVIDLDPGRATYLQLVDPTNGFALQTGPTYGIAVSQPFGAFDFAYLPSTQLVYGFNADGRITSINPLTGAVTVGNPVTGLRANDGGFGATFADATGKLYAFHNNTGRFYKIDPVTNAANALSTSVPSNSNDGANCVTATICDIELTQPDPQNQNVCVGGPATFSVTATGTGTLIYQWQVSSDGVTWTDLSPAGGTDANGTYSGAGTSVLSLTPATTAWNGNQYRIIVDSDGNLCTLTSGVSTLTVNAVPTAPVFDQSTVRPACPTTTVDLTLHVTSTAPSGSVLEFYTSETPTPATLVGDPTVAGPGTYYAFYTNPGCSSPASASMTVGECNPMPVTLVSFTVTKEEVGSQGTATLNWATTAETNSDRFEIERSQDAQTWSMIGMKDSNGESNSLKRYDFIDQLPARGINYYRLKMVDNDASFSYSRIQKAEFGKTALSIYPNPVSQKLYFKNFEDVKRLLIYNAAGSKMMERDVVTSDGVDITRLKPGIYTITLTLFDGTINTHKVAVTR